MGEATKTLSIYLESRDQDIDIDVDFEYEVECDGIGPYEFHGQKCYDKGKEQAVIISYEWDKTGFTAEEVALVEAEIEKEKGEWEGEIDISDDSPDDREDD